LIAAAVAGLGVGDVVILDEKGRVVGPSAPSLARDAVPPLVEEEKAIEDYYEARVRQALERAYPQERIGVTVVADLAASADTTTLPEWNPAARTFPLEIALASASTLDSASQEIMRGAVTAAIGSDATTNDTVVFGIQAIASEPVSSTASAPSGARRGNDRSTVLPESSSQYDSLSAVGAALMLVMLILLAVVSISRLRGPRRLTAQQRNAFAAKLRSILERGDNNVAAPS
jgi:flagellar biosynthesis/type III secretory pathway M-ring protein FliF/YscJ